YVKVDLGSNTVNAGQSGCVPVTLTCSTSLTNIQFLVNVPAGSVANASINPSLSNICSGTVQTLSSTQLLVNLQACAGQSVSVTQQVATLCLTVTNQSGTVPLNLAQVTALRTDGSPLTGDLGTSGLLTVISSNPPPIFLEARIDTNGVRRLILHGVPGDTYAI